MKCTCIAKEWYSEWARIEFCPLHAATPDLLAACKEALERFEGDEQGNFEQLQAAIAKAEGKQ